MKVLIDLNDDELNALSQIQEILDIRTKRKCIKAVIGMFTLVSIKYDNQLNVIMSLKEKNKLLLKQIEILTKNGRS